MGAEILETNTVGANPLKRNSYGRADETEKINRAAAELARAEALCDQAVHDHGASADAFYLKGLLSDAGGDTAAAQRSYRKAIYLDPAHREALTQLAACLSLDGDEHGARLLLARAERATGSTR